MVDEEVYEEYLESLLDGDGENCAEIVDSLLDEGVEIKELYVELIQRSMYKVGELWESGEISVADEHLATSITERILSQIYPRIFSGDKVGKSAVIACVANEYHQLGGRMVADFFELHGWDGYFVGADAPLKDLLEMLDEKQPDLVGLSLAMYFNLPELLEFLEEIRKNHPNLEIIVGGRAFQSGGSEVLEGFRKVRYVSTLEKVEEIIK